MQAADGELYVIGIVESDGWANDEKYSQTSESFRSPGS